MRYPRHPLLELLWPSRGVRNDGHAIRMAWLQTLIAMAIFIAAGPEIFAAIEMTTLLELLGASLFLTAYFAGARLAATTLWRAISSIMFPAAQMSVLRSGAPAAQKALASIYVAGHAAGCIIYVLVFGMYGKHIFQLTI